MTRRSLRNGAIVVITLAALTGVGTMVASASTRGGDTAGTAAQQRGNAADPNAADRDGDGQRDADGPDDADRQAANGNACVAVRVINPQDDDDARLCTTVQGTRVRVSLTAPSGECRNSVTLQLLGTDQDDVVSCADTGATTATFALGRQVANGTQVCGALAANADFAAARACVRVTG